MTDPNPPDLATIEDLARRFGILVRWAVIALVASTAWVTLISKRVNDLEKSMDKVVERLDPVREALGRIQDRLGIQQPEKPK